MAHLVFDYTNDENVEDLTYDLIEKQVKKYKVHRSALDFDLKFIQDLSKWIQWMKYIVT